MEQVSFLGLHEYFHMERHNKRDTLSAVVNAICTLVDYGMQQAEVII